MNDIVLQAVVGILGLSAGALLTLLASFYTAKQRIKELDLVHRQKLDENHLENARLYMESLCVPINIGLTRLAHQYDKFCRSFKELQFSHIAMSEQSRAEENKHIQEEFERACKECITQLTLIFTDGKDVYLTTELAKGLQSFLDFIELWMTRVNREKSLIDRHCSYASSNFNRQFHRRIENLKILIRKVTLGTPHERIQP